MKRLISSSFFRTDIASPRIRPAMTGLLLLGFTLCMAGTALAAPSLTAPTTVEGEPSLYLLLRLPGDRADIRYSPGHLDRAANLQGRFEPSARIFEKWSGRPFSLVGYVLNREEWEQAKFATTYGIPIRVGRTGVAAPALGDDQTVRLWANLLQGMLPTVQGLPLRGTPQHAASVVAADIITQLLMAQVMADDARLEGDRTWVRGLMSHVIVVGLTKRLEESRLRELDAFYELLAQSREAKAFSARDYDDDLTLEDWLWFQAQFHTGAKILVQKEGKDAIKKMIKLNRKKGTIPGDMLLNRYKPLNDWFREHFSAVSMRTDR